ncbi:TetR/AcrR family transcriptional regulator [Sphingomonas morindae]|uniref:TetR/AcrR family transcriptional regulator n=1 Tax=Sphingomonas morindae TaxID=1541170 RepID=A0ABY4XD06_9SPHN|nr:TetR/AcrR family transcriptional regulator [Sphingomonas morindae]USI74798.1 TetR/AcrR family transcriptional regulator [Sphingomonas morindae]
MTEDRATAQKRRPRADGERNRERLLAVAKQVFTEAGASASLEHIARQAGVGIGTLYRHYPTRDALIEAVYRQEIDALAQAGTRFAETMEPVPALRAWLHLFIDFVETKHDIGEALGTLIGGPEPLYSGTPALLSPPITKLVEAVNHDATLRITIPPLDLLRAIVGVGTIRPGPNWKEHAVGLVALLLNGASDHSSPL